MSKLGLQGRICLCLCCAVIAVLGCVQLDVVIADAFMHADSYGGVQLASRLLPGDEQSRLELARADPNRTEAYLREATALNPWDTTTLLNASLLAEANGEEKLAGDLLQTATDHDARPSIRWAFANFDYRQGDMAGFYRWAAAYRKFPGQDTSGLLRLAWEQDPDAGKVMAAFSPMSCEEKRALLGVIEADGSDKGAWPQALAVVPKLATCVEPRDADALAELSSLLLAKDHPDSALQVWNAMAGKNNAADILVPEQGRSLTNGSLRWPLRQSGFDWHVNRVPGVEVARGGDGQGLQLTFDGAQPNGSVMLYEPILLIPGRHYALSSRVRGDGVEAKGHVGWRLFKLNSGAVEPVEFTPHSMMRAAEITDEDELGSEFVAPDGGQSLALALVYLRPAGQRTLAGTVNLREVRLEMEP